MNAALIQRTQNDFFVRRKKIKMCRVIFQKCFDKHLCVPSFTCICVFIFHICIFVSSSFTCIFPRVFHICAAAILHTGPALPPRQRRVSSHRTPTMTGDGKLRLRNSCFYGFQFGIWNFKGSFGCLETGYL